MAREDFWDDPTNSQEEMKTLKGLKDKVQAYEEIVEAYDDVQTMITLAEEEDDESLVAEIKAMAEKFIRRYETLRIDTLLSGPYDLSLIHI